MPNHKLTISLLVAFAAHILAVGRATAQPSSYLCNILSSNHVPPVNAVKISTAASTKLPPFLHPITSSSRY